MAAACGPARATGSESVTAGLGVTPLLRFTLDGLPPTLDPSRVDRAELRLFG